MRGLASLMIIDAIMEEIKTKNSDVLRPCEVFDLIGGTSVGGLISILLGRLGLDCRTAIEIYKTIVNGLFGEQQNAWKVIEKGEFLKTTEFDKYIAQKVKEFVGSSDALMDSTLEDGQDPLNHPSTMVWSFECSNAQFGNTDRYFFVDVRCGDGRRSKLYVHDYLIYAGTAISFRSSSLDHHRSHESNYSLSYLSAPP